VENILKNAGGTVLLGGIETLNKKEKYLSPTIIKNPDRSSLIMTQEIFAPILPIVTYSNFDEALSIINSLEKPLAIYYMGNGSSKNFRRL
jgi:aldehyde dehydrogenase (NAD+)